MTTHKGSCLCGKVKITVKGSLSSADACHCKQCQKWTGFYGVSTETELECLTIDGTEFVKWFESSEKARRGFCISCGTHLFFDPLDKQKHSWTGIYMGVFDSPTNVKISHHIFVAEKGDYYDITDSLPQNQH